MVVLFKYFGLHNVYVNYTEDMELNSSDFGTYSKHNDSPSCLNNLKTENALKSEAFQGNFLINMDRNDRERSFQKECRLFVTCFNINSFKGDLLDE